MRGKKARMLRSVVNLTDEVKLSEETTYLINEKGTVILGACERRLYKLLKKGQ